MLELILAIVIVLVIAGCSSLVTRQAEDYSIDVTVTSKDEECSATASAGRSREGHEDKKEVNKP
jgi:uncharacterized protein YceK